MQIKRNSKESHRESNANSVKRETKQKLWLGSYLLFLIIFLGVYFLLQLNVFKVFGTVHVIVQKVLLGGSLAIVILIITKFIELFVTRKSHSAATRYNLLRVIRLIGFLLIALVLISVLFVNWYTAAVSLGLISLILGFALQTPISSFIGWLYIVIRAPYHVGDRIQVNTFTGDVIEIGYLDTTLWEFAGDYITNDLPSGRLIRFPNSMVLQSQVYNYSWKKFPFIWNEIPLHIAYESDFQYVETIMRSVAQKELGDKMMENIRQFKELVQGTPIDDIQVKEYPFVCFRVSTNTWVEAIITYLVEPKQAATVRTRLIKEIIAELLKNPDKVLFPKSNAR